MQYTFNSINKETLLKLYTEFGIRAREIGSIVGVSEDAILKRLKQYEIPTNSREKDRLSVEILYTGKRKDKKKELSEQELYRLCKLGYTDEAIGSLYNMTGEGIAYRRKKNGIFLSIKNNDTKNNIDLLKDTSKEILEDDYYNSTQKEFSNKYSISKTVWRPHLKKLGIKNKELYRIENYPPFNKEQRNLIIGSLLGDGSVSQGSRYYESHSIKQRFYLLKKHRILEPYSNELFSCDEGSGLRFNTIFHPNFLEFYNIFYEKGIEGKLIPVDFIKNNWSDSILAYWYFDDGYFDDEKNEFFIGNLCPKLDQLESFLKFLNEKYDWGFKYSFFGNIYNVTFSKKYYENFVNILLQIATPDVYYKIPEKYITPSMVLEINFEEVTSIKPKFYRLATEDLKIKMETVIFNYYRKRGFPYSNITEKRLLYLLGTFKELKPIVENSVFSHNASGIKLCENFFPNIYECNKKNHLSPIEQWNNDKNLQRLIKNRLQYADRLSDASLRTGIKLLFDSVTNFKPNIAKYIYSKYASNGKVFDYSCGFGSRMLAAVSLDMEYTGCEPNLKTYNNLLKFGSFLEQHTKGKFFVTAQGSEEFNKENYFDIAFSSPPFFDYEHYSNDSGQSIVKYPDYEEWLVNFWKKTIENCFKSLILGGHFGVCISINQHQHMIEKTKEYCSGLGSFTEEYVVPYKQLFQKNEDKYDLILIYKKSFK
jgi:hypothetical protein